MTHRQDSNLGEDKGGLLGPKKDKYKLCSLLDKAHPKFWVQAAEDSQFYQAPRYQNGSKGLVWHYRHYEKKQKRSFSKLPVLNIFFVKILLSTAKPNKVFNKIESSALLVLSPWLTPYLGTILKDFNPKSLTLSQRKHFYCAQYYPDIITYIIETY